MVPLRGLCTRSASKCGLPFDKLRANGVFRIYVRGELVEPRPASRLFLCKAPSGGRGKSPGPQFRLTIHSWLRRG